MRSIKLMDRDLAEKIAAGEVVERPGSIVKEMCENSIDAGSTAITVEIKEGGVSLVRIADNGCGIPSDEVRLAFCRHSTSKMYNMEELENISYLHICANNVFIIKHSLYCTVLTVEYISSSMPD